MSEGARLGPVLVTGGTGFIGSHVVRRLVRRGREVHVLARASSDRSRLAGLPLTWHAGDLGDPGSLHAAVLRLTQRAAELGQPPDLVHAAALISYRTSDAGLARRLNVEATGALLDASNELGVGRFCLVSSVVAVGHAPDARSVLDEEARFNGAALRSHYVTTKRAAEDLTLAVSSQLDTVVVAPGAVFGRHAQPSNTARFLVAVARNATRGLAPPGSLAVVGVEDVAEGILLALERGGRGRRYILTESNLTVEELMRRAALELGTGTPRARVPQPLWGALVAATAVWDRLRPLETATPQALRLLGAHFRFDPRRARDELGWRPRPFAEVLRETAAWIRDEGWHLARGRSR